MYTSLRYVAVQFSFKIYSNGEYASTEDERVNHQFFNSQQLQLQVKDSSIIRLNYPLDLQMHPQEA